MCVSDRKNIKHGAVANNNAFSDDTVPGALPSSITGKQNGGGGYVSTYRHRILEERQRNKTAKSLQQKVSVGICICIHNVYILYVPVLDKYSG